MVVDCNRYEVYAEAHSVLRLLYYESDNMQGCFDKKIILRHLGFGHGEIPILNRVIIQAVGKT